MKLPSLLLLAIVPLLAQCRSVSTPSLPVNLSAAPLPMISSGGALTQVINVSSYDPKERHREGRSYTEHDVSALRANGAHGLIARAGKGGNLDDKCVAFLQAADRSGMLPGVYYRVQKHVSPIVQADQMIARAEWLARSRDWNADALLLCGDYDGDLSLQAVLGFMDRVESRTGVVPVTYIENSQQMKLQTSSADAATQARLRRAPYWVALYSHTSGAGPIFPAPGTPDGLAEQYAAWPTWTMWQYAGVAWENRRSRPKVYSHGRYQFPTYFGDMDRPLERNVFRGTPGQLARFWKRHGLALR